MNEVNVAIVSGQIIPETEFKNLVNSVSDRVQAIRKNKDRYHIDFCTFLFWAMYSFILLTV